MATIYYDSDADFDLLKTRTIAVIVMEAKATHKY